jgi:hypothetical protein
MVWGKHLGKEVVVVTNGEVEIEVKVELSTTLDIASDG